MVKHIAGQPERYYVRSGKLIANASYMPTKIVVNALTELEDIKDKIEPGAIAHVVGTRTYYELSPNKVWTEVVDMVNENSEG